MIGPLLYAASLFLLIGLPLRSLDARLTPLEGHHAARVLAPLEGDPRAVEPRSSGGAGAAIRAFCAVAGTGEASLRASLMLTFGLSFLLLVPALPRSPEAFAAACAIMGASSLVLRPDFFQPAFLAIPPAAAVLGGIPFLSAGRKAHLMLPLLGGLSGFALSGRGEAVAAALIVAVPLVHPARGIVPRVQFMVAGAAGLVLPRLFVASRPFASSMEALQGEGGVMDLLPWHAPPATALVVTAVLVLLAIRLWPSRFAGSNVREAALAAFLVFIAAAAAASWPPWNGQAWAYGSDWAAMLAPLGLLVASLTAGLPITFSRGLAVLLLLAALVAAVHTRPEESAFDAPEVLTEARGLAESGGRMVLSGPRRFVLLHYSRRGYFPMVPILIAPEDGALEDLLSELPARLGPGKPGPRILIYPPLASPAPFTEEFISSKGIQAARLPNG